MQLREYQEQGLQALWSYFMKNRNGHPVLAWPCGTGKSLVPAEFIRRTLFTYPNERFMMATHVKELIRQNYEKLEQIMENAPVGIYSAGLKRKEIHNQIIYGGIQSMFRHPDYFGWRDILFIDEAHLVSLDDASMYISFIAQLKKINPNLKIVGLSATPYRIGQGLITEGGLFTDIIHDLTSLDNYNKLIYDGYIAPHVAPSRLKVKLDISNVGTQKGEFIQSQLQHEVDRAEITWKALQETCYYGQNRKSWLIFASGIEHSNHIAEMLNQLGINCASVHSKQSSDFNDSAIKAFKNFELRAIVNYGKLTTGFDHPGIDLIDDLRPTLSTALHVQKLGRGGRIAEGKLNCIVLDHAGNVPSLGCINDPVIPRKKGDKIGTLPVKICECCGCYHHIKATHCDQCGKPFEFKVKISEKSGRDEIIANFEAPKIEFYDVNYITYTKHEKANKPPSLKVTYFAGMDGFSEYICLEHKGLALHNAHNWWRQRTTIEPPKSIDEARNLTGKLRQPKRIRVYLNRKINGRKIPEILSHEFGE